MWNKFRLLLRQRTQLIKRIEGQKLDAATLINIAFAELLLCLRHQAIGAAIAISNGQAHTLTLLVEQHKVHAPGINPNAIDTNPFLAHLV